MNAVQNLKPMPAPSFPGVLDTKPERLCFVAGLRKKLVLRALGNVEYSAPNYGNTDLALRKSRELEQRRGARPI